MTDDTRAGVRARAGLVVVLSVAAAVTSAQVPTGSPPRLDLPPPSTGWLIISGPPGPAVPCSLTRAYNVEDGSAFVDDACADRASAGALAAAVIRDALEALLARTEPRWTPGPRSVTRTWLWVVNDDVSLIGDLPWPDSTTSGSVERALVRVRDADARLVKSCADAAQELTVHYRAARERWARLSACSGPDR